MTLHVGVLALQGDYAAHERAVAARLAAAAKRPGATKSALVEAALDRFLGSDDDVGDTATVARRLAGLSHQIEQLDRNLRIANETAAINDSSVGRAMVLVMREPMNAPMMTITAPTAATT